MAAARQCSDQAHLLLKSEMTAVEQTDLQTMG